MTPDAEQTCAQLRRILATADPPEVKAKRVAALVRQAGSYRWVGLYHVGAEEIAVIAWSGPAAPTHPRFPRTGGLNGVAVRSGETVIVGDVTREARYLVTHGSTRSEMIVPAKLAPSGAVVGTIDVESERADAFDDSDRAFVERCAAMLVPLFQDR
jgi:putative methionine-R-sulfoxide reductase with GAF domain